MRLTSIEDTGYGKEHALVLHRGKLLLSVSHGQHLGPFILLYGSDHLVQRTLCRLFVPKILEY